MDYRGRNGLGGSLTHYVRFISCLTPLPLVVKNSLCKALCVAFVAIVSTSVAANGEVSKSCNKVSAVKLSSNDAGEVQNFLEQRAKRFGADEKIYVRAMLKLENWYEAEIEYKHSDPEIVVIKKTPKSVHLVSTWEGIVENEEPRRHIASYFKRTIRNGPRELFDCFIPNGPPFNVKFE
jgi:hypothetical protein